MLLILLSLGIRVAQVQAAGAIAAQAICDLSAARIHFRLMPQRHRASASAAAAAATALRASIAGDR